MTSDNHSVEDKPARSRTGDGFVMLAMALVTLALCLGLVIQVGLSPLLAVAVSAAFYISLLTFHSLRRRQDQLEELKGEVQNLKAELARVSQPGAMVAGARPRPASAPAVPAEVPLAAAAPPQAASPPVRIGEVATDRLATALKPPSPSPIAPPHFVAADEAAPPLPGTIPARAAAAISATTATTSAPQVPQVVRAPQPAAAKPGAASPGAFGFRPGERSADIAPPAGPPREADVESIQGLIRKLANEVDATPPADDALSAPATTRQAEIDRSIGALRQTAASMKDMPSGSTRVPSDRAAPADVSVQRTPDRGPGRATPAAGGAVAPPAAQPPVSPRRKGIVEPADKVAAAPAVPPSQVGSAGPQSAAPPAPAAEDEFDVEALMRRAQPIASMTSRPPPLPRATDRTAAQASGPTSAGARTTAAGMRAAPADPGASSEHDRRAFEDDTAAERDAMALAEEAAQSTALGRPVTSLLADDVGADPVRAAREGGQAETMPWPEETGAELSEDGEDVPPPPGLAARDPRLAPIAAAIEDGRVDVFLEPILDIEQQQARHYQVSVRLRDEAGQPMQVDVLPGSGMPPGALALIDELLLARTAHVAELLDERGKTGAVFATLSGQALASDSFLTTFAETFEAQPSLAGQLVLTFSQADARLFNIAHWSMLKEMRDLGFAFALEDLTDLDLDLERFVETGFKFVKIAAEVFLEGLPAPGAVIAAEDLGKFLMDEGLVPIVVAIDDEALRQRVEELDVRFGQGRLFGGPRLMKAAAARSAA